MLGTGLRRMVFSSGRDELAPAIESMIHSSLQQSLTEVIRVEGIDAKWIDESLQVVVRYLDLTTNESSVLNVVV